VDRLSNEVEAWQARADLPWHAPIGASPTDVAMVSLHSSPVSDQALVGSIEGLIVLGEESDADEEHLERLRSISDMLQGASWEDVADEYGPHHADAAGAVVGKLFGKLRRRIKKIARGAGRAMRGIARDVVLPIAPHVAKFIPGAGPAVSMALQAATPALQRALRSGRHLSPAARFAQRAIRRGVPAMMAMQPGMQPAQQAQLMAQRMRQRMPSVPQTSYSIPQAPPGFAAWR
jgi:hypothetical protein